jgi:hypothetical protein
MLQWMLPEEQAYYDRKFLHSLDTWFPIHLAVGSQLWKLLYYRDLHIFQKCRSYPQILGTRKVKRSESKNKDSTVMDCPVGLTVTWQFLPCACELIYIFVCQRVKKKCKTYTWGATVQNLITLDLYTPGATWICLVQALVHRVVLNGRELNIHVWAGPKSTICILVVSCSTEKCLATTLCTPHM